MAQAQAATNQQNNQPPTNGADTAKRESKKPTPIEAIHKIGKILDMLSSSDRKRVLAWFNVDETSAE